MVSDYAIVERWPADTNDSGEPEESRDEYVPLAEYGRNLQSFAAKIRAFQPKAKIGWLASTPVGSHTHTHTHTRSIPVAATLSPQVEI
jgi:hypothetical protein